MIMVEPVDQITSATQGMYGVVGATMLAGVGIAGTKMVMDMTKNIADQPKQARVRKQRGGGKRSAKAMKKVNKMVY